MPLASSTGKFVVFGATHWVPLAALAVAAAAFVGWGRRRRNTAAERRFRRGFAVVLATVEVAFQVYSMLPGNWALATSLPFELCDLAWMAAAVALWTGASRAGGLLYYWGLTLTAQALLTPRLDVDFPQMSYIMFFVSHGLTVLAAVYVTWGAGLVRPSWRLLAIASAVTLAWGGLMLAFNSVAGTNYLFVSHKPATRSLLDWLGGWPWYLLWEVAVGITVWTIITLPWQWAAGSRETVTA